MVNIGVVRALVQFLGPFKEATDILEASATPTLHRVMPCYRNLMEHLAPNSADIAFIAKLKELAKKFMEKKFEVTRLHWLAVFLNPKMRSLKVLRNDAEREETMSILRRFLNTIEATVFLVPENDHRSYANDGSISKRRKVGHSMDDQAWEDEIDEQPQIPQAFAEVDTYKNMPVEMDEKFDLLLWWKKHSTQLPRLSQLARHVLSIPASSAPSERNFSTAGLTVDKLRSKINPKNVDDLLFLRSNMDMM